MWKDIKDWEQYYEVSDKGEVRNKITKKMIVGDINSSGYYRVCLYNKNHNPTKQRFFRHRLVAETFLTNPKNYKEVNHKDHDLSNNSLNNLEWIDKIGNELDSRIFGSKEYKPFQVEYNNGDTEIYHCKRELADKLKCTPGQVKHWLHGITNSYIKHNINKIEYIL